MRSPGQRAGLSRAAVLTAARELIEADGAGALSMRALARRLDVAPNALYSHVADRTDLLDQLLDDLLAAIAVSGGIETMMISTYRTLVAHPQLIPLFLERQGARGPNAVRLGEILDGLLAEAGVADVPEARRVLIVHAIGFAAFAGGPDERTAAGFTHSLRWLLTGMTARHGHMTEAPTPEG